MKLKHAAVPLAICAVAGPAAAVAAPTHATASKTTVTTRMTSFGKVLTTGNGMPLYLYTADTSSHSNCGNANACIQTWPALIKHGRLHAAGGVHQRKLATIARGSKRQVKYAGHPLYTFYLDSPGQPTGEGQQVGSGKFYLVGTNGKAIKH